MSNFEQQVNLKRLELDRTVNKIKDIRAQIKAIESKVKAGKIIFRGVITEDIIYVGQEGIIYHQLEELNFSICLPIEKASKEQAVELTPWIEYLDFQLADEGKYLEQKIMLKVHTLLMKESQLKVKPGVAETYRAAVVVEEIEKEQIIENKFKFEAGINEIKEIEKVAVKINNLESKTVGRKAIIQGRLQQQFFFCDERDISRHEERESTFGISIDIPDVNSNLQLEVDPLIESIDWQVIGSEAISTRIVLKFQLRIIDFTKLDLALDPTGQTMVLDRVLLTDQKEIMEVNTFELDSLAFEIRRIEVELTDLELGMISDYIIVEGQLEYDIYYLANLQTEANVECHQQETVPVSAFIQAPGIKPGMKVSIDKEVEVSDTKLLEQSLLKQRTFINLGISAAKREQVKVAVDETGPLITGQQIIADEIQELIVDISN